MAALPGGAALSKYGNVHRTCDGVEFDSGLEAARWRELKLLSAAGEIQNPIRQPTYTLQEAFRDRNGRHYAAITYTADFEYTVGNLIVVEDVKGATTQQFALRRALFCHKFPEVDLRIMRRCQSCGGLYNHLPRMSGKWCPACVTLRRANHRVIP